MDSILIFLGFVVIALIFSGMTILKLFKGMGVDEEIKNPEKIVYPLDEGSIRHAKSGVYDVVTYLTIGDGIEGLSLVGRHEFQWGRRIMVVLHLKDEIIQEAAFTAVSLPGELQKREVFSKEQIIQ